jgi:hypothetical protein
MATLKTLRSHVGEKTFAYAAFLPNLLLSHYSPLPNYSIKDSIPFSRFS